MALTLPRPKKLYDERDQLELRAALEQAFASVATTNANLSSGGIRDVQPQLDTKVPNSALSAFGTNLVAEPDASGVRTLLELGALAVLSTIDSSFITDFASAVDALIATSRSGTAVASATLSGPGAGNLYSSSGAKLQYADATDLTKPCNVFVAGAFALGATASYYTAGQWIGGLTLTPGATYWLDVNAGQMVTTPPPSGAGHGSQMLGHADDSGTRLWFNPQQPIFGI